MKPISLFVFMVLFLVSFSPACASKKYVRTNVQERVAPLEGRTAELEGGSREQKNRTDTLENRTNVLSTTTKQVQTDLSNLDQRSSQGIEEAKNQAAMAKKDALAETAKVDNRINNLDNWQEKQLITLNFSVNRHSLTNESKEKLDELISQVLGQTGYLLEIKGFTDATGTLDQNRKLSQMRAESVFQYLVEKNVSSFKINTVGLGEINPISNNITRVGRTENRRVEVRVFINEGIKKNQLNAIP